MEKESNFVSAVLYLHNAEETARGFLECVCGVLARHFLKYEVVCVNDASDDRTAAEVREFAAEHPGAPVLFSGARARDECRDGSRHRRLRIRVRRARVRL